MTMKTWFLPRSQGADSALDALAFELL
ncbi:MAG: hypothetical protein RLZ79_2005, partial [Pseudomonadota bacterium]